MRHVCLLRGINVSGHRKVSMKELLALCSDLGFQNAVSYLQSGNLVFDSTLKAAELELTLEREISGRFGYADVAVMARTATDLANAIKGVPDDWKNRGPSKLYFSFLKSTGKPSGAQTQSDTFPDEYAIGTRVVYVYCPDGYGRTRLNNSFFERLFAIRATTRNWNTTSHLLELARS